MAAHLIQLVAVQVDQPPAPIAFAVEMGGAGPRGVSVAGPVPCLHAKLAGDSRLHQLLQLAVDGGGADGLAPAVEVFPDLVDGVVLAGGLL